MLCKFPDCSTIIQHRSKNMSLKVELCVSENPIWNFSVDKKIVTERKGNIRKKTDGSALTKFTQLCQKVHINWKRMAEYLNKQGMDNRLSPLVDQAVTRTGLSKKTIVVRSFLHSIL